MTPKKPSVPVEPITARVSSEAARRLRVAAAMENLSTGQFLGRLILQSVPSLPSVTSPIHPIQKEPSEPEET